ncbi:MAG: DUF4900 domain-containing protein [Candidatus Eisenbacteria bacterium]|uniref:DUF4900 domain-containing protein n=1 Tax=Eiseniibacteriota bacterium TaxID=2212470 RepID=A0A849SCK0_UNCEI|nr:DUF4900 domain-containing protein [Candidatus Eisenbacteria bacterium]
MKRHEIVGPRSERGVALVTAVLFVLLAALVAGTFLATTTREQSVSSSVHVAKASLYSADAGVRTAQQMLANLGQAKMESLATLRVANGNVGPVIPAPNSVFPTGSMSISSSSDPKFTASTSIAWADSDLTDTAQVFNYRYRITSTGQFGARGVRAVETTGLLRLSAGRGTFADYLMFTDIHTTSSGTGVWFNSSTRMNGRVHTNGIFRFALQPQFTDLVSSVNAQAWYNNNGSAISLAANSNGSVDVPQFGGGFQRGAGTIALPTTSFLQQNATLGQATPSSSTGPTNAQLNMAFSGSTSGSSPADGIYPVTNGTSALVGGIYIKGNVNSMRMSVNGGGHQVYTIVQGSTTKTITINRAGPSTTIVTNSGTPVVYTGVPSGSIFCSGSISDFGGPDRADVDDPPIAGLADNNQTTITAAGDIVIQSDVLASDYDDGNSVLGIYSNGGNVRIGSSAPPNLHIDAFLMATGSNGQVTVDNYSSRSPSGDLILRGGMVSKYYGGFGTSNQSTGVRLSGYGRLFSYDRRGITPPFYPQTPAFNADVPSAQMLAWKEL